MGERVTYHPIEIPLSQPFETASGRVAIRRVVLVRVGSGPYGWGEAAPFPGQDETIADVLTAVRSGGVTPTLIAAQSQATADFEARVAGVALGVSIGVSVASVPVCLAVGLGDPAGTIERAVDRGVSRFKLKIKPGSVEHVASVRTQFPGTVLGVDANGSFAADTLSELDQLADCDVAFIEQPVRDLNAPWCGEHLAVWGERGVPVFADESVRSVADAQVVLRLDYVAGVVVKPGRLGWRGSLAVRAAANDAGKLWRSSGLVETGIGRVYTDTLAACDDAFTSDVAPAEWFLTRDVAPSRFTDGHITLPGGDGIGITPDGLM